MQQVRDAVHFSQSLSSLQLSPVLPLLSHRFRFMLLTQTGSQQRTEADLFLACSADGKRNYFVLLRVCFLQVVYKRRWKEGGGFLITAPQPLAGP